MIEQHNAVSKLQKLGTAISYPHPNDEAEYKLSLLVFVDAPKGENHGQVGTLAGQLFGDLEKNSICHSVSCIFQKSKRSVKSVPVAEILALSESIDEAQGIAQAYSEILNIDAPVHLCIDSKDLFKSLLKQIISVERSIRGDFSCIRFEFQVHNVDQITWITHKTNLVDSSTKRDSPLADSLQLTLFTGLLNISYKNFVDSMSNEKNYCRQKREY